MLPDYWIERPAMRLSASTRAEIDDFLATADGARSLPLDVDVDAERWEFLCGVAGRRRIAFHGTGDGAIECFEPRRPIDYAPFGDQEAVFATSDPIWAMFYAIVDRDRYELTLNNACIVIEDAEGRPRTPHYYFSISRGPLRERPWRDGYVYFLPSDSFVEQPPGEYAGYSASVPQLASPVPVTPFARMHVSPDDFPFLDQVRGHEDERLAEYAQAVMAAAPWPD